jgi:hypothetical protein
MCFPLLLSRHTLPASNTQAPPTLISPRCITPPQSTPLHRPQPSHSSTRSTLLQALRRQHPTFTSGLHPFRPNWQGRKSFSPGRDNMRGSLAGVTSFATGALYLSGPAYATRHLLPASPNKPFTLLKPIEPSSLSSISPSPLAQREHVGAISWNQVGVEQESQTWGRAERSMAPSV